MRRWRWPLLGVLVFVLGCGTPRDSAVHTANSVTVFTDRAQDVLADRYKAALAACLKAPTLDAAQACTDREKGAHAGAWAAYRGIRAAWLALAAVIEASDALGEPIDPAQLAELLKAVGVSLRDFQALTTTKAKP